MCALTAELCKIIYKSYNNFSDLQFIDVISAPFHVVNIFDNDDDASWFTISLLNDIFDYHAPCKTKVGEVWICALYEQWIMQGLIYKRNTARNKFRKYGKMYSDEKRTHRNKVVSYVDSYIFF